MSVRYRRTRSSSSRSSRSFAKITRSFGFPPAWGTLHPPEGRPVKGTDGVGANSGATIAAPAVYRTRQVLRTSRPQARRAWRQSSGTPSGSVTRPEWAPAATATDSRCCLELVDGGHVVGTLHQPLHQPLAGQPVLDLVPQHQAQGAAQRRVGHRRGHLQVAGVGRDQPRQDHPVEPGQPGQRPRARCRHAVGRRPRRPGAHLGHLDAVQRGEQRGGGRRRTGQCVGVDSGPHREPVGEQLRVPGVSHALRVEVGPGRRPGAGRPPRRRGWRRGRSRSTGTPRRVRPSSRAAATRPRPRRRRRRPGRAGELRQRRVSRPAGARPGPPSGSGW